MTTPPVSLRGPDVHGVALFVASAMPLAVTVQSPHPVIFKFTRAVPLGTALGELTAALGVLGGFDVSPSGVVAPPRVNAQMTSPITATAAQIATTMITVRFVCGPVGGDPADTGVPH